MLSPHLDDAVLSAWSVLTEARDVVVVNVFAGVPEARPVPRWDRLAGADDCRSHMKARLAEDRAALALVEAAAPHTPSRHLG